MNMKKQFLCRILLAITLQVVGEEVGETRTLAAREIRRLTKSSAKRRAYLVNCIVFDKIGTLTVGKTFVVNTNLLKTMLLSDFYRLVAVAEANNEHPLAKVMVESTKSFRQESLDLSWLPEVKDFVSISGHGVRALVQDRTILVGNTKLMVDFGITISEDAYKILKEVDEMARIGISVTFDGELVGIIEISDPVKPEASDLHFEIYESGMYHGHWRQLGYNKCHCQGGGWN